MFINYLIVSYMPIICHCTLATVLPERQSINVHGYIDASKSYQKTEIIIVKSPAFIENLFKHRFYK